MLRWHTFAPEVERPKEVVEERQWNETVSFYSQLGPKDGVLKQHVTRLANLLRDNHWSLPQSDQSIMNEYEAVVGERVPPEERRRPRNMYTYIARLLTPAEIRVILGSFGEETICFFSNINPHPKPTVVLDHNGSDEYLEHRGQGPVDTTLTGVRRLASSSKNQPNKGDPFYGRGLDPTRHWGTEYDSDTGQELMACCGRPARSFDDPFNDGCWYAMDAKHNPLGVIVPYKLWFETEPKLWERLAEETLSLSELRRLITTSIVIGTAFEDPSYYRGLHESIVVLLKDIADDIISAYIRIANALDDQLLGSRVEPKPHLSAESKTGLQKILDLQSVYNKPQFKERTYDSFESFMDNVVFGLPSAKKAYSLERRSQYNRDEAKRRRAAEIQEEEDAERRRYAEEQRSREQERRRQHEEREQEKRRKVEEAAVRRKDEAARRREEATRLEEARRRDEAARANEARRREERRQQDEERRKRADDDAKRTKKTVYTKMLAVLDSSATPLEKIEDVLQLVPELEDNSIVYKTIFSPLIHDIYRYQGEFRKEHIDVLRNIVVAIVSKADLSNVLSDWSKVHNELEADSKRKIAKEQGPTTVKNIQQEEHNLPVLGSAITSTSLTWKDNSCPFDSLLNALFKLPGTWLQTRIMQAKAVRSKCSVTQSQKLHNGVVSDIIHLQTAPPGTVHVTETRRHWASCFQLGRDNADDFRGLFGSLIDFYMLDDNVTNTIVMNDASAGFQTPDKLVIRENTDMVCFMYEDFEYDVTQFGKRVFDITPTKGEYTLLSCVSFQGGAHWVSYVRDPSTGGWWYFNANSLSSPGVPVQDDARVRVGVAEFEQPCGWFYVKTNSLMPPSKENRVPSPREEAPVVPPPKENVPQTPVVVVSPPQKTKQPQVSNIDEYAEYVRKENPLAATMPTIVLERNPEFNKYVEALFINEEGEVVRTPQLRQLEEKENAKQFRHYIDALKQLVFLFKADSSEDERIILAQVRRHILCMKVPPKMAGSGVSQGALEAFFANPKVRANDAQEEPSQFNDDDWQ